tara:strand:+ start:442 stop:2214 length:1773 start_codon:yes stop_codon:yes gene_type:complete
MARTHVNVTDHILDMKNKVNEISYDVGDIALISTSGQDSDVVQAINSLDSDIGGIANLTTIDKSSIKAAINELDAEIGADTLTTSASTVKGAINEHEVQINNTDSDIGTRTNLTTDADQNLVVAINEVDTNANTANATANANTVKLGTITSGAMGTSAGTVGPAISELHTEITSATSNIGALNSLTTTNKSNLVAAVSEVNGLLIDSAMIKNIFSATNTGTGYGALTYGNNGVYSLAKVTNTNIRSAISAGEGIDIASGVISGELASYTNIGIAKFDSDGFTVNNGEVFIKANGISATQILDGAVTTVKIADNAVTTAKILNGNVTTAKIVDNAVTAGKILNGNVTTVKIADDAVTYAKLQNLVTANRVLGSTSTGLIGETQVQTAMIATNAVTTAKILNSNVTTAKIADVAVTAAKIATNAVTATKISSGAVTTDKIAADAVTYAKLQNLVTANRVLGSTSTGLIGETQVQTAMIAAGAVTDNKIPDDAILSRHYSAGSIDPEHLASNAVTEIKIASNAVTSGKIAADAVNGTKIADNAINSEHYAAGSIDNEHIADDAVGADELKSVVSLIIYNSAGTALKTLYGAGS